MLELEDMVALGPREALLVRPQWVITNQLLLPTVSVSQDRKNVTLRGIISIAIPITIFLDTLFDTQPASSARSIQDDQLDVYNSMEGILQSMGLTGKSCLLRTICELQAHPIGRDSLIGEIISILLSPKAGVTSTLDDYTEAELMGQSADQTCDAIYAECPVSVFELLRNYSSYANEADIAPE